MPGSDSSAAACPCGRVVAKIIPRAPDGARDRWRAASGRRRRSSRAPASARAGAERPAGGRARGTRRRSGLGQGRRKGRDRVDAGDGRANSAWRRVGEGLSGQGIGEEHARLYPGRVKFPRPSTLSDRSRRLYGLPTAARYRSPAINRPVPLASPARRCPRGQGPLGRRAGPDGAPRSASQDRPSPSPSGRAFQQRRTTTCLGSRAVPGTHPTGPAIELGRRQLEARGLDRNGALTGRSEVERDQLAAARVATVGLAAAGARLVVGDLSPERAPPLATQTVCRPRRRRRPRRRDRPRLVKPAVEDLSLRRPHAGDDTSRIGHLKIKGFGGALASLGLVLTPPLTPPRG